MGKYSKIAWTDHTFNAWIGCQKVSPGCQFCYAENETFVRKERSHGRELWGPSGVRHRTSPDYWAQPIKWNKQSWWSCSLCGWRGPGNFVEDIPFFCPECGQLAYMKSTRQRVFCMSMGDILEDRPELDPWRAELVALIEATPNLDWLILTKRIELAPTLFPDSWFMGYWPANAWMGTSVENQKMADERIPELIKCPAPIRFLSVEPLLERISISHAGTEKPSWVIIGGESGRKHRPFDWDWARSIRDECLQGDVPFFMKQGGGYPDKRDALDDMPADLRIREWPR